MNTETTDKPRFQIGDEVFVAEASSYRRVQVKCPVCFGNLSVEVILGNGEVQPVECEACGIGFDRPRGFINAHEATSRVFPGTVDGITRSCGEWQYEIGGLRHEHVFATESEAEAKRVELLEEAKKEAERINETVAYHKKKTLAWKIRYHREEIARAERTIAWNRAKLSENEAKKAKRESR